MTPVALAESRFSTTAVAPPAPPTSIEETGLHPDTLSQLLLNCDFVKEWKTEPALTAAKAQVKEFLAKHTSTR